MGDDACWLDRTCLSCGRFFESDHVDDRRCPHCGAERVEASGSPLTGDARPPDDDQTRGHTHGVGRHGDDEE